MSLDLVMALKALVILGAIAAFAWHEIRKARREPREQEDGTERRDS